MILIAVLCLTVFHPGVCMQKQRRKNRRSIGGYYVENRGTEGKLKEQSGAWLSLSSIAVAVSPGLPHPAFDNPSVQHVSEWCK